MEGLGLLIIAGWLLLIALSGIATGVFFDLRDRCRARRAARAQSEKGENT